MDLTLTNIERQRWMDAVRALLADCKIGLYTNAITVTGAASLADLVEPTFAGYVRTPMGGVPNVSIHPTTGRHQLVWPTVTFQVTTDGPEDLVIGYFVLNQNNDVAWIQQWEQPVSFATTADDYTIEPVVQLWSFPTT